jgi:hypothetical protein
MPGELGGYTRDEHLLAEIRGAVARGWVHKANEHKVMDVDLAESISREVYSYIYSMLPIVEPVKLTDEQRKEIVDVLQKEARKPTLIRFGSPLPGPGGECNYVDPSDIKNPDFITWAPTDIYSRQDWAIKPKEEPKVESGTIPFAAAAEMANYFDAKVINESSIKPNEAESLPWDFLKGMVEQFPNCDFFVDGERVAMDEVMERVEKSKSLHEEPKEKTWRDLPPLF